MGGAVRKLWVISRRQMTLTCALSILLTTFGEDIVVANGGSSCVHGFDNLRVLSVSSGDESRLAGGSSLTL